MTNGLRRLGILVGGGPAPGINSAISAVTIEATNLGFEVVGIFDGYQHLVEGRTDQVRRLSIPDVSRIHSQGGSILRTARTNPTSRPEYMERCLQALHELDIQRLVSIGGDDTAFAAFELARLGRGAIRVAHLPKTIDNDLPLPAGMPTFGFETVRHFATEAVLNLMEETRTTNRWAITVVMGRQAGHLALGIGRAAGATLTLIPEEFPPGHVGLRDLGAVLEGSILKRRARGYEHGVAVIAEGIAEKVASEDLARSAGLEVARDPYGHVRLEEIPLATLLKREVRDHFEERGDRVSIIDVTLGYTLRSAPPIPFDIDYTRTLGHGAVRFLVSEQTDERVRYGGLICLDGGNIIVVPFDELRDSSTGRVKTRGVDVNSHYYRVARDYMIRLEPSDLEDRGRLENLAQAAKMTPEAFRETFATASHIGHQEVA